MGIPTLHNGACKLALFGVLALCGLSGPSSARAEEKAAQQAANAPYAAPLAKLQVTGSAEKFSVDADHADVLSVLKVLFNQANAQFTTDSSVVGQVTMRLSGQSLSTTLDAVCKQLLLRYHKDSKGIYVFEQDTEAAKAAITHLKDLDALLRQQLRFLGLSVPEDSVLEGAAKEPDMARQNMARKVAGGAQGPGGSPAGSGFGGGGARGGGGGKTPDIKSAVPNAAGGVLRSQLMPGTQRSFAAKEEAANGAVGRLNYLTEQDLAQIFALNAQNDALQNPDNYRAFMQQNGLVFINTGGQKAVVTDVLQELGRQSNTRILIDSSVPTGRNFSLQGYITPRTLPEALNVLTQSARLNWRWVPNGILVSALPDFQLFFNSTTPRVIYGYGNTANPTQQYGGQGQGQQSNNPVYGAPSRTPLPITNGEKKTP